MKAFPSLSRVFEIFGGGKGTSVPAIPVVTMEDEPVHTGPSLNGKLFLYGSDMESDGLYESVVDLSNPSSEGTAPRLVQF